MSSNIKQNIANLHGQMAQKDFVTFQYILKDSKHENPLKNVWIVR